ncbi:MAG: transcriptional regulator [Micrococcales bacterium]|jgi:nitrogen regulatory protein P-II 2|nr:transcriptional regulator [Micrococcales bacterium]MDG1817781.1 transcriptional regulator [Aquiluna sp.]MBT5397790.1 transcriptional regulator [Micrococcales bacterium]MBT5431194.1 transcriptional regulator [Micrococcales bacterium]MBT5847553.1 transcriptional regulator [Micrococcales bacterium]
MLKKRKLLVVVIEAGLVTRLARDVMAKGAKGYTVTSANGLGPRNQRAGDLEGGNAKLETVVPEATAEALLELLKENYFPHYACSAWVSDVEILRDDRY